jgi:hypothetical protein
MAQVLRGHTLKNINDQRREVLETLYEFEVVSRRAIKPVYTIILEKGSAFSWEVLTIEIAEDGYGVMHHSMQRTYFRCAKLPAATRAAFDKSTVILHYNPPK